MFITVIYQLRSVHVSLHVQYREIIGKLGRQTLNLLLFLSKSMEKNVTEQHWIVFEFEYGSNTFHTAMLVVMY